MSNYAHTFRNPTFLNQRNERMPNAGGWQGRHMSALELPNRFEVGIVGMLDAWAIYADAHAAKYDSGIGDDGALGHAWRDLSLSIRTLLNGECGRLDRGTLDGFICDTLMAEHFE